MGQAVAKARVREMGPVERAVERARAELVKALAAVKGAQGAARVAELATVQALTDLAMVDEVRKLLKPRQRGKPPSVKRGKRTNSFMKGMDGR